MTNKYEETVAALEQKVREMILICKSLQKKNSDLEEELKRKHSDLMRAHQDVLTYQKNYEQLRIAQGLATTEDEKKTAKQSITKLVREIDKCLTLLTTD